MLLSLPNPRTFRRGQHLSSLRSQPPRAQQPWASKRRNQEHLRRRHQDVQRHNLKLVQVRSSGPIPSRGRRKTKQPVIYSSHLPKPSRRPRSRRLLLQKTVSRFLANAHDVWLTYLEPMQGMSEDEGDPDDEPEVKIDEEKQEAARKAREERAERLRKMMEDDGESDMAGIRFLSNWCRRRNARRASRSRITA